MNGRKYDELKAWEKAFYDLNKKIGNDVWGARLEADGSGKFRMRVFISHESFKAEVLKETGGSICDHPLVFTVYEQDAHALSVSRRAMNEDLRKKAEEYAKSTLQYGEDATRSTDGDLP